LDGKPIKYTFGFDQFQESLNGVDDTTVIQVKSVRKHRADDSVIPSNDAEAVNIYQSKGLIHGRS
jgi:hypothetical protein